MTLADLAKQLDSMPPGTLVPRDWLVEQLREATDTPPLASAPDLAAPVKPSSPVLPIARGGRAHSKAAR